MPRQPRSRATPRGITIIEVLVALVLVAIGMLGIAGSSALMLRAVTTQAAEHRAIRLARLRIASLTAGGCADARDGNVDHPDGLRESWRMSAAVNGARTIDLALEWIGQGRPRRLALRSGMLC